MPPFVPVLRCVGATSCWLWVGGVVGCCLTMHFLPPYKAIKAIDEQASPDHPHPQQARCAHTSSLAVQSGPSSCGAAQCTPEFIASCSTPHQQQPICSACGSFSRNDLSGQGDVKPNPDLVEPISANTLPALWCLCLQLRGLPSSAFFQPASAPGWNPACRQLCVRPTCLSERVWMDRSGAGCSFVFRSAQADHQQCQGSETLDGLFTQTC